MCDKCHNHPASVHVERIENGTKSTYSLCMHCAEKERQGLSEASSFDNMIKEFLGQIIGSIGSIGGINFAIGGHEAQMGTAPAPVCAVCAVSLDDLREEGKFGCSNCYRAFGPQIDALLKNIHGSSSHTGKTPAKAPRDMLLRREIDTMRKELKEAIEKERYETAAVLRDRIRASEHELKEHVNE